MKEVAFKIYKRLKAFIKLEGKKIQRVFVKTTLSREEAFKIPIVINNRNRFSYLKGLVDWLQNAGYTNIIILDNDSTYPPLLEYYKHTTAKVIYLKKNVGYKALWEIDFFKEIRSGYYVYTDPDLLPNVNCPKDLVYQLYEVLSRYNIEKCGPALKIDDLPDHYAHKQSVLQFEKKHWELAVTKNVYDAPLDTTFALYKPFAEGNAEEANAYRVAGDLEFFHLPWYEDSENLSEESNYYKENVSSSSYWYSKK